jgi:hypothetical protein
MPFKYREDRSAASKDLFIAVSANTLANMASPQKD